ncbi:MAG: DNA mismatch repair protein MutS [Parvularculaceae bacterium]
MDASSPDLPDVTPMMAQYLDIKSRSGDAMLFYRMGDFYELFFDDAIKAAAALDIALTRRGKHLGQDIPMCGVPYHSYEAYLARLIRKGFKVAICEQTEDPAEARKRGGKSVVRRAIARVVTPGTLTEEALLDSARANHLGALALLRGGADAALAWMDISTGDLQVRATSAAAFRLHAAALAFSELVVSDDEPPTDEWRSALAEASRDCALARHPSAHFDSRSGERRLREVFAAAALDAFGDFSREDLSALGALLSYVSLTQVGRLPALKPPRKSGEGAAMLIDAATRASLEILQSQSGGREGSLFAAVDRTATGPGARLLAQRLSSPLTDPRAINERLAAVAWFAAEAALCERLGECLRATPDMARALSRLTLGRGGPRDLAAIRDGLCAARDMARDLNEAARAGGAPPEVAGSLHALDAQGGGGFSDLIGELKAALAPDLPLLARDGGFIARDFDPGLDAVRLLRDESRRVIAGLETQYRQETDLRTLKVRHNNVLGYYVETPPSGADRLQSGEHARVFIHRQTIATAVRFTTTELADLDARIARARDESLARELELFARLSETVAKRASDIADAADAIAAIDVAASLASLAREDAYVRPVVDESFTFVVERGRHPVVEQALRREGRGPFIANDCRLGDDASGRIWLVTGPNMAGKSTFLRQNALIAILAQAGSFVPAASAHIGVADRIFSRVGASDDLARGRSTFMVEMVETAAILNQASPRALVVLDEIGRGTSTFDGLSIAWAAVEHLHQENRSRALFATHYHELTALSRTLPRLENVSMRAREWKGDVVFLHEVAKGPADRSYGVAVARLAGLPASAIARAQALLTELEARKSGAPTIDELPLFAALEPVPKTPPPAPDPALEALFELNPDRLTPREALDAIYRLKSLLSSREAAP